MKLTRPRPSAFFVALSLLLCAAVAVLWVRSYWQWDSLYWSDTHRQQQWILCGGRVVYARTWFPNGCAAAAVRHLSGSRAAGLGFTWEDEANRASGGRVLGFEWAEYLSAHFQGTFAPFFAPPTRVAAVPCWAIFLATAAWPAARLVRRRHRRRRAVRGLCARCGYDLRATPGQGGGLLDRCPECGAVPGTSPAR